MPPKAKSAAAKPAAKKRAPKNTHQLAPKLPKGEVLTDFIKKEWKVGEPIGSGGFGLIYLADQNSSKSVGDNAQYVLKVEPHSNGPLFCELHFYQRAAKPELIKEWMSQKKIKHLGMPKFIAAGSCDIQGTKCRFMIMERFGTDLQKIFEKNGKRFPVSTVMSLGCRILDTLEYIHSRDYCHADIKASNILMGHGSAADQVYLVDYGLAFKYIAESGHKDYREDPKRTHDGTIEFTSRDAHKGVCPSRRADLEILAYCMVQWLCSRLPWEDKLADKEYVSREKFKHMADIPGFVRTCFPAGDCPDEMVKFLQYVTKLKYDEKPDYVKCKQLFKKAGGSETGKITLSMENGAPGKTKTPAKRQKRRKTSDSSDEELEIQEVEIRSPPKQQKSLTPAKRQKRRKTSDSSDEELEILEVEIRSPPKQQKSLPSSRGKKLRILSESSSDEDEEFEHYVPRKQQRVTTPKQKSIPKPRKAASSTAATPPRPRTTPAATAKSPAARAKSPAARVKSPAARVKSPAARARSPKASTSRVKTATSGATRPRPESADSKPKARNARVAKITKVTKTTQTSPGLLGLRRSRKVDH